ncbi:MAG: alpha-L-rhamnosidase, partial [Clostridia bacterium]|nr:alpha-L-rhamnosidase [Clostridia bacterium]
MAKDKYYRKDFINDLLEEKRKDDNRTVEHFLPLRILWKSNIEGAEVKNEKALLENTQNQISLSTGNACVLENKGEKAGILLDFGMELQGGIEIYAWNTGKNRKARLRVRFGESAMEAMSELGGERNATNDHAIRDLITEVSWLGMTAVGNTGFRFVRIDLEDEDSSVELKMVRANLIYKNLEYKGIFRCNDELLNEIWRTSVYTVQLNMQDYLWDGIKRDRLVWIGDMHPEVSTIKSVFGYDECVPKSLDFIRDETPLPGWMNTIPAYSMWWILIQHTWYIQNGNIEYLTEQYDYLKALISYMSGFIAPDGSDYISNNFIDWPSSTNPEAQKAGVHALFKSAFDHAAELFDILQDTANAEFSRLCS